MLSFLLGNFPWILESLRPSHFPRGIPPQFCPGRSSTQVSLPCKDQGSLVPTRLVCISLVSITVGRREPPIMHQMRASPLDWTSLITYVVLRARPPRLSSSTLRVFMAGVLETRRRPSDATFFVSSLFRWLAESMIFRHGCQIFVRRLIFQGLTSPSLPKRGFRRSISTTSSSTLSRGKDTSL